MTDKVPDENKREGSDDLQEPANKKPRDDAGPSQGPKPVENFQDVGDRSMSECPVKDCDWKICDLSSDEEANEVSSFLEEYFAHYRDSRGIIFNQSNGNDESESDENDEVESDEKVYEYHYSNDNLLWLLCPPGFKKEWHIVVQDNSKGKLVAFAAAIPRNMKKCVKVKKCQSYEEHAESGTEEEESDETDDDGNEDDRIMVAEVKFLCVLPQDERLELEPLLLNELARMAYSHGAEHLVFASINHFTDHELMERCKCWSRPLNIKKLLDIKFIELDEGETVDASQVAHDDLLGSPATHGLRKMEARDVPSVTALLGTYLIRFDVAPLFNEAEVEHWFLPRADTVESYVVETEIQGITHFISFSTLSFSVSIFEEGVPSTTIKAKAARSLYNVSTQAEPHELLKNALALARLNGSDFFEVPNIKVKGKRISGQTLENLKFYQSARRYFARLPTKFDPKQHGLVLY